MYAKKMEMIFWVLLACLVSSTACAQKEPRELLVFAGAGMRLPLNDIGKRFEEECGVSVIYDFEGSGRLGNKILVGQAPDVFIPGSERWAKILKERDYIREYAPVAYHTPVIITPKGNSKINSLEDFVHNKNQIVLGDVKASAIGEACAAIFDKAGLDVSAMHIKARGVTVKQLVFWIEGNNADASIVWKADALQSGKVRFINIPGQHNAINIIPVCRVARDKQEAAQYVRYLLSHEAKRIFKKHGFEVVK